MAIILLLDTSLQLLTYRCTTSHPLISSEHLLAAYCMSGTVIDLRESKLIIIAETKASLGHSLSIRKAVEMEFLERSLVSAHSMILWELQKV